MREWGIGTEVIGWVHDAYAQISCLNGVVLNVILDKCIEPGDVRRGCAWFNRIKC